MGRTKYDPDTLGREYAALRTAAGGVLTQQAFFRAKGIPEKYGSKKFGRILDGYWEGTRRKAEIENAKRTGINLVREMGDFFKQHKELARRGYAKLVKPGSDGKEVEPADQEAALALFQQGSQGRNTEHENGLKVTVKTIRIWHVCITLGKVRAGASPCILHVAAPSGVPRKGRRLKPFRGGRLRPVCFQSRKGEPMNSATRFMLLSLALFTWVGAADIAHAISKGKGLKALDAKYGFRDGSFGMLISSTNFQGAKLVEDGGDTKFYSRPHDKMTIGGAELDQIVYGFYKGKLGYVHIETKGYLNSRALLEVLQKAYGPGYKSNRYIEKYHWFGKKVSMTYDENSITDDAGVFLSSRLIREEEAQDKKRKAEAGADQL